MKVRFSGFQQLGRALMLPIAVLPIAGLLLRLGQPDLLNWVAMAAAGNAIFLNLGLLFAVGVAVGLARENHGAAGLAAVVGYLVTTRAVESMMHVPPGSLTKLSIPVGLLSGIVAGVAYNRYSNITLPSYLSFFGGRRFVPIVSGIVGLVLGVVIGYAWPFIEHGMDAASHAILNAGPTGLFAYGVLNRILIVTGLHHILNNFAWFILGDYHGVTGDLNRFFAGDPSAGAFMSGFFPVMMFGLPGACLAMYHTARAKRRADVAGLLLSLALTSFLTGVTEPVEFTFMFLAPVLYALHAIATGLAMVIMDFFGVHLGFSFSAGLFDYVLNFTHAQRPLLLIPIGAAYFVLYYAVFRLCILRLNLPTPGRESDEAPQILAPLSTGARGPSFVTALGGAGNLTEVTACTTRLRLELLDNRAIDEPALKGLGSRGLLRSGTTGLQVVIGPIADQVAGEIRDAIRAGAGTRAPPPDARPQPIAHPQPTASPIHDATPRPEAPAVLAALGGRQNVSDLEILGGRLSMRIADRKALDERVLMALGIRGIAHPTAGSIQLLISGAAESWAQPLRRLLAP
ncbi:MAG TPA: N-acetylglucosamine-specific PTS transporter subunit IIBC [Steroidobacteraceae bacterium]|jgi:PTS system N-acetylglucosamine-specific IIC component|nr:N-acetylglucosamine-specific PTS transporter subunit IIBC [Steroidobacteraceae bacterium]